MIRTIEIEDNLQEYVDSAIEQVKDCLIEYIQSNPDLDECPGLSNDLDYDGRVHEIIDGSVPIWTQEIEDTYYLYSDELDNAFDNAGCGDRESEEWLMGWKAAAIYFYIEEKVADWYEQNAEEIFAETTGADNER